MVRLPVPQRPYRKNPVIIVGHALQVVDVVFYNQLTALGGAVSHSGDCRKGEIVGDDEVKPPLSSYHNQCFDCAPAGDHGVSTPAATLSGGGGPGGELVQHWDLCRGWLPADRAPTYGSCPHMAALERWGMQLQGCARG